MFKLSKTAYKIATPPASTPSNDSITNQARAAAAAPASVAQNPLDAFGGAGPDVGATAPTTVTQQTSPPAAGQATTSTNSSSNVYIYEPLEGGFDRYDFNSGKKVFTPNNGGPSMNASGNTVTPESTPRTPIDGGIPVGTTTAATGSLLRQRQAALSGGAG